MVTVTAGNCINFRRAFVSHQPDWRNTHWSGFRHSTLLYFPTCPAISGKRPLSVSPSSASSYLKYSGEQEKLWRDLLADPSNWLDNRLGKFSPGSPDFKHKRKREALWLDNGGTPTWVSAEVVALFGSESEKAEKLWRKFFADPSKWWDNRSGEGNPSSPDFKQKMTGEALWVDSTWTPAWVKLEIASIQRSDPETKWQDLFSKPSEWWDHRSRKGNPKFPDFIHKLSTEALWLHGRHTPEWVASKVAYLGPGTLQTDLISTAETLSSYNKAGNFVKTMELYEQMQQEGVCPDCYIFLQVLHACAAKGVLQEGRRIHEQIVDTGWDLHPYINSSLVDMYAKCGSIKDAQAVFNKLPIRDMASWTAMITGFVKCGQGREALELYQDMQRDAIVPDSIALVALLNACASMSALNQGRSVHRQIIRSGYELDVYVGNALVDMYSKCGSILDAKTVFDKMPSRDVVAWNSLILGFVKNGQELQALELFEDMQQDGVVPDSTTFLAVLNACASVAALEKGRSVHSKVIQSGCESHAHVANSLLNMYSKCGSIEDAQRVFDNMTCRDVVAWNAMILGFVKCGRGPKAFELFQDMQLDGIVPDSITFVALLNACANMAALNEGQYVHNQVVLSGCESDIYVASSLVDMYAKCGNIKDARRVFDKMPIRNVVAWNAMIAGLVKCGQGQEALKLFQDMQCNAVMPNPCTFVSLLNACASMAALEEGQRVHKEIIQSGFESDVYVGSSLVDMYAKCGSIEDSLSVFEKMTSRDVVAWTSMIRGFAMHGFGKEAIAVFEQMSESGCEMNEVTFICLLSACSHGSLVKEGLQYFEQMQSVYGVSPTEDHFTCLVDILARSGHLADAEATIKGMPSEPSDAIWRSLLGACRTLGNSEIGERASQEALKLDPENASGYVLLANIYAGASHSYPQDERECM